MIRISFGLGVEQRGEALVGSTGALIPIVFDIEKIKQDEEMIMRLLAMSSSVRKSKWNPKWNRSLSIKIV